MTRKYFKIISLAIKNFLTLELVAKAILEYGLYFVLFSFVLKNVSYFSNYSYFELNSISGIYLIFIYLYKYFLENSLIFRYMLISGNFDLVLTRPINPMFRILINKVDFAGLIVVLALAIATGFFGVFLNPIPIFSGLVFSISIYIIVQTLLLKTLGNIPFEKLLLSIFLAGFLGISNQNLQLPILFISILLLFIFLKFWNYSLTKYTGTNY